MSNETPQQPTPANELLEALGTTLSPDLLVQALTHRSFSHEHPGVANYERLEFLGDAVLELVSTETLFTIHPDMTEGQLAKMRAKAVSEDALSAIAKTITGTPWSGPVFFGLKSAMPTTSKGRRRS